MSLRVATTGALTLLLAGGLAACGSGGGGSAASVSASSGAGSPPASAASTSPSAQAAGPLGASCSPGQLKTLHAGVLTLGADQPVYPPWYVNNDPTNGKGFEDAVAYAVATELGYRHSAVHWTRVTFNQAIEPGPKAFDYDLDEFSITPQRRQVVDFSAPYYDVVQAVVGVKHTVATGVRTLAGLRSLPLGAEVGTTSYAAIVDQIHPTKQPRVYNTNQDAIAALQNGQIQGLVTDLPTAFELTSGEVKGGVIVGQLPSAGGHPEQFGILLDKGSALTGCVSRAVDALRADGTLARLQDEWLAKVGSAPVLH